MMRWSVTVYTLYNAEPYQEESYQVFRLLYYRIPPVRIWLGWSPARPWKCPGTDLDGLALRAGGFRL